MSRKRCCLTPLLAVFSVWLLTGCPKAPQLALRSETITVGDRDRSSFQILNAGGGTLEWQADVDTEGVTLVHAGTEAAHIEGTTLTETDSITVKVNRAKLPPGTDSVLVTVRAGDVTKTVTADIVPLSSIAPSLLVSPQKLDFTPTKTEATLTIQNAGSGTVSWTIDEMTGDQVQDIPWLKVDTVQGDTTEEADTLKVTATLDGLSEGKYTNLGLRIHPSTGRAIDIPVTLNIPSAATVSLPSRIDFGSVLITGSSTQSIALNSGDAATPLELTVGVIPVAWLKATLTQDGSTGTLDVTADAAGLAPGDYSTTLQVIDSRTGYVAVIAVSVTVDGTTVKITDPPDNKIDFGKMLDNTQKRTVTLTNFGTAEVPYMVTVADTSAAASYVWLAPDAPSGNVPAKGTKSIDLTATVDETKLGVHSAEVSILYQGVEEKVFVTVNLPPRALNVNAETFDFGASESSPKLLAIWNSGRGTINWTIDTSKFSPWLTLKGDSPGVSGSMATNFSGSVAGERTDWFKVQIDRGKNTEESPAYTFGVVGQDPASGAVIATKSIKVTFYEPPRPHFEIDAPLDEQGVPSVSADIGQDSASFILRNTGQGLLSWNFGLAEKPDWITALTPQQGEILPGRRTVVTFSVDRTGLDYLGRQFKMTIFTNDPEMPERTMNLSVHVPKVIAIGVKPDKFGFGGDASSDVFAVANVGDPGEMLDFKVTPTKDWLSVYPDTGQSQGTPSGLPKDWKYMSVSIDRAALDAKSASAKLLVSAFRMEDGKPVPREDVTPVEVEVTASAAGLTIEAAVPNLRIPSQVRYVLMMRDIQYRTIPIPNSQLDKFAPLFGIFENDMQIETSESQQYLTPLSRVRGSVMIMLDYSGSMFEAARMAREAAGEGEVADPLQALYVECISNIISEMPSNYRIALCVFNERAASGAAPSIRTIGGGSEPLFTYDRDAALGRLAGIEVIDHGATSLYLALMKAASASYNLDFEEGFLPFDNSSDRALICVTDGRVTTPPGTMADVATLLSDTRVRPFFIGWGDGVQADSLIRIATSTGGHFYSTKGEKTGEFDAFGSAIRVPVKSDLLDWCAYTGASCDESVARDLASQVVLNYITLNESAGVRTTLRPAFDDPNDQEGPCFPEQGIINGMIAHANLPYDTIAGEVRLGQVSMRSDKGRDAGAHTADVVVRADYTPRNINHWKFKFRFRNLGDSADVAPGPAITQISGPDGGMISPERFSLSMTSVNTVHGTEWHVTADLLDTENPLKYGEFGDLFRFSFSNVAEDFVAHMEIPEAGYYVNGVPSDTKFFTCPDAMTVLTKPCVATSFPSLPGFTWTLTPPSPVAESQPEGEMLRNDPVFAVPEGENFLYVNVWNMGGSRYDPSSLNEEVSLFWRAKVEGTTDPYFGSSYSSLLPSSFPIFLDRGHRDPGGQFMKVAFDWTFDTCLYADEFSGFGCWVPIMESEIITFSLDVTAPLLMVTLDTAPVTSPAIASFTIGNGRQSYIPWKVDDTVTALPANVYLANADGNAMSDGVIYYPEETTLYVTWDGSDPWPTDSFDITIKGTSDKYPVTPVTITVTPPPGP